MKAAGLRLAACVVEALPYQDRNTPAVQAEAWKLFERQVKVRQHPKPCLAADNRAKSISTTGSQEDVECRNVTCPGMALRQCCQLVHACLRHLGEDLRV